MTTLRLDAVGVRYGDVVAVSDVSLEVAGGEWVGLIGPNGAGKSSLLRAVAGLVACTGSVTLDGAPLGRGRSRAQRIALVSQTPVVPPGLTVAAYVLLGRTPHLGLLAAERQHDLDVVTDVLARLSLSHLASRRVDTLSGGERQRAVVARALAQQAPVLLLDEPTTGLDVGSQQEVLETVSRLCAEDGLAVLSAMHDLTAAGQFADRLALVSGHEVAVVGSARSVLTERRIGEHYGARVRVVVDDDTVVVIPTRGDREEDRRDRGGQQAQP